MKLVSALILSTLGFVPSWLPPTWDDLLQRTAVDLTRVERCQVAKVCSEPVLRLLRMVAEVRDLPDPAKVGVLNRTVNMSVKYTTDDHWASPLETTERMSGNCVAEAILKATVALLAGVPAENMRLALVNDSLEEPGHAVLLMLEPRGWTVLDNRSLFKKPVSDYPNIWAQLSFRLESPQVVRVEPRVGADISAMHVQVGTLPCHRP
jgi:predicted transglutaminase-like cysteine proteinase